MGLWSRGTRRLRQKCRHLVHQKERNEPKNVFDANSYQKKNPLRHSQKDIPSDLAKNNPETNDVFAVVRSGGYSNKKMSRSHPWEQNNESKKEASVEATQSSSRVEKSDTVFSKTGSFMEDVEVYRGDYLMSDAYLSSISEDSSESFPKQQQQTSQQSSSLVTKQLNVVENARGPSVPSGNSFSDRLKMFQSKDRAQAQLPSFRRSKILSQTIHDTAPVSVVATDLEPKMQDQTPVEASTTRREVDNVEKMLDVNKHDASSMEQDIDKPRTSTEKQSSTKSHDKANTKSEFSGAFTAIEPQKVKESDLQLSGATNTQPERGNTFVHQSASRFGLTLGQRRLVNRTSTNAESTKLPAPVQNEPPSPIEPVKDEPTKHLSPQQRKMPPIQDSQRTFQAQRLSAETKEEEGKKALTPRKQSKSMSVLERSRMFERSKDVSTASATNAEKAQWREITHLRKLSKSSSCTIVTCDKCGSSIKAPRPKDSSFVEKSCERQISALSYRISEASNKEEEIDSEEIETSSDVEEDDDDSDDESTVVGSRRDTLKSAPRTLNRIVKIPTTIPVNLFGAKKNAGSKEPATAKQTQKLEVSDVGSVRKVSTFSERMKIFERPNLQASSGPNHVMGQKQSLKQLNLPTEKEKDQETNLLNNNMQGVENGIKNDNHHPCSIVNVDDTFSLRDDTSGLYSNGSIKSDHRVVALPDDRTPYYAKKLKRKEAPAPAQLAPRMSLESKVAEGGRRSSSISIHSTSHKVMQNRKDPHVSNPKYGLSSEATKMHPSVVAANGGKQRVSSSISNKLAMFEKKPQRKWSNSKRVSTPRKSVEGCSFTDRRKSRKSSLSLQDVLDSRNNAEENRNMTLHNKECHDPNVEENCNVRPSHLLKKLKENVAPGPPSPLVGRRGFSSMTTRPTSGRNSNIANLRCF